MSFNELPIELLTIIFRNYIRSEGHVEFLENVIPVCKTWRDIGLSFSPLCKIVNIAGTKNTKRRNLPKPALTSINWGLPVTTELNITYVWLNQQMSEVLFSGCPNLKSLVVSDCRVHATTFAILVRHCKKLELIAVDRVKQKGATIKRDTLQPIFLQRGSNLKSVSMSKQKFRDVLECGDLVTTIFDNCPRLEQLELSSDLNDWPMPEFPEGKLRSCCPRLRVLSVQRYVVDVSRYTPWQTEALRNLRELELISLVNIDGFLNVLRNAVHLKQLSLKDVGVYCDDNFTTIHQDIGSKSLEKFQMVDTIIGQSNLKELLKRWRHSLKELTLVDDCYFASDQDLLALVRGNENPQCMNQEQKPSLEVLNLSVPIKDWSVLVQVVRECKRLRALDTSKCSKLPKAYRWKFDTIEEIDTLRYTLCS